MSTELFINFDKNTQKTTTPSNNATVTKNDSKEKKEGMSLFDSLMNDAKSDDVTNDGKATKEKVSDKEKLTELNKEEKTSAKEKVISSEEKTSAKEKVISSEEKNIISNKSNLNSLIDDTEKVVLKDSNGIKNINTVDETNEKKDDSIKKLVEKLVDIVVNAAKDIFDKKDGKKIAVEDVKTAVEKVLDKKIETIEDKKTLEKIISNKLDIVQNSVEIIKSEVKENSLISSESVDTESKKKVDISKEIIKDEVKVIKDNVKEIHKDISVLDNKKQPEDKNIEIKKNVENSLTIIDESSNEIETIIANLKGSNKKEITNNESSLSTVDQEKDTKIVNDLTSKITSSDNSLEKDISKVANKIENKIEVIKEAVLTINEKVSEVIIVKTTGEDLRKKDNIITSQSIVNTENSSKDKEKPLLASMFLNAQKTTKNQTSLEQIKDAKSNINDKKSIEAVKVSAEKLDLKLDETEVTHEEEQGKKPISIEKKDELKTNNLIDNKSLNRALLNQKIEENNLIRERNTVLVQKEQSTVIAESEKRVLESVEMQVPKEIIPNLQNKIIGAHQRMGSFMSEVARNMYLNYKPPVTAFRVNLNPANLGSVSIMMKANKVDNSLTVSMNLSNSNTMEAFTENKVALQNAIQRQFNETSNISISFNFNDQSSDNQFGQSNDNNQNKENYKENNNEIELENVEENEIIATNDYM